MTQPAGQHIEVLIENIYDQYSAMVFGILLQICPDRGAAEKVLVSTFQKFYLQHKTLQNSPCIFVQIIKYAIETVSEQLQLQQPVIYKSFRESPLLQHLLFKNASMKECENFLQVDRTTVGKMLRHEILQLKAAQKTEILA